MAKNNPTYEKGTKISLIFTDIKKCDKKIYQLQFLLAKD